VGCRRTWSGDVRRALSLKAKQLDFEDQRRIPRNRVPPSRTVPEVRRHDDASLAANPHPDDALTESGNDPGAHREGELVSIDRTALVLRRTGVVKPEGIVHGRDASSGGGGARADAEVSEGERDVRAGRRRRIALAGAYQRRQHQHEREARPRAEMILQASARQADDHDVIIARKVRRRRRRPSVGLQPSYLMNSISR